MNLKEYLENISEIDYDKPWIVYRVFDDYGERQKVPMKTFDTEEEANAFADNEYKYDPSNDQVVVEETK